VASQKASLAGRAVVQVDRAFWCIHEHLDDIFLLALPAIVAIVPATGICVLILRTWELPPWVQVIVMGVVGPWLFLSIFTVFLLPSAVFGWQQASGVAISPRECFAWCLAKRGRLFSVLARLSLMWLLCFLFFGIPFLVVWPRTCMAPLVALFEDGPGVFRRSRRILREDFAIYVLGGLFLGMAIVLGGLVATPRLLLGTSALGAQLLDEIWRQMILDHLWIFEALCAGAILVGLAMTWWIALTLLYHDIRWWREGMDLRQRVTELSVKFLAGSHPSP
jgi:hypothetical protein